MDNIKYVLVLIRIFWRGGSLTKVSFSLDKHTRENILLLRVIRNCKSSKSWLIYIVEFGPFPIIIGLLISMTFSIICSSKYLYSIIFLVLYFYSCILRISILIKDISEECIYTSNFICVTHFI